MDQFGRDLRLVEGRHMAGVADATKRACGPFNRAEDLHCVLYHVFCLLAYASAFWVWFHPELAGLDGFWDTAAFVTAAAFLLGWISGVDVGVNFHNHSHKKIFRRRWMNDWFGRIWTFSGGWPSYFWQHAHVTVHHANLLADNDWTLPKQRPDGRFENLYSYVLLHWPWRYAVHLYRDFRADRAGRYSGRRALLELSIFAALWSVPFWIDWRMALCLWVLPQWIGNAVTMGSGMYAQHAGSVRATEEDPVRHSNTYLSPFFNATMFNIGYHVEHHDYPGVHWADLPEFHAANRQRLLDGNAHVLPYGYYRAATILSGLDQSKAMAHFCADQAESFPRREAPAESA